jgi:hypothetical protein
MTTTSVGSRGTYQKDIRPRCASRASTLLQDPRTGIRIVPSVPKGGVPVRAQRSVSHVRRELEHLKGKTDEILERTKERWLTVLVVDRDKESEIPQYIVDLISENVQPFFKYPTRDRLFFRAMVFHQCCEAQSYKSAQNTNNEINTHQRLHTLPKEPTVPSSPAQIPASSS